ncbi:putative leader peptide [Frankia nepalensis]|nr:putative leader peptide [Frankia nepalensis]
MDLFAAGAEGVPELLLVARLHVDLLRVASAGCRRAR